MGATLLKKGGNLEIDVCGQTFRELLLLLSSFISPHSSSSSAAMVKPMRFFIALLILKL